MNFDISEKDKKLIFLVLGLACILLSYFVGFRSITAANTKLSKQVKELTSRRDNLREKAANYDTYVTETDSLERMYQLYLAKFQKGNTPDDAIQFFKHCEDNAEVNVTQVTFEPTTAVYQFGNITSSNPDVTSLSGASPEYQGFSTAYHVTLNGTYEEIKKALSYISSNGGRKVMSSIAAVYDASMNEINVSLTVVDYSINTGAEFVPCYINGTENELDGIETGLTNIFNKSESGK